MPSSPPKPSKIEHIDRAESEKIALRFLFLSQAEIENETAQAWFRFSGWQAANHRTVPDTARPQNSALKHWRKSTASADIRRIFLDGSSGFVNHDGKGLEFDHYPDHQKVTLSWTQVEKYIDLMIQSDRYLTDKEKEHRAAVQEAERQLPMLDGDAAAEYNALKEQYPNTLIGFELGGYFLFYDKDAITVKEVFRSNLLSQENALGKVKVTGFLRREWVAKSQKAVGRGQQHLSSRTGRRWYPPSDKISARGRLSADRHHHQARWPGFPCGSRQLHVQIRQLAGHGLDQQRTAHLPG